MCDVSNSALGAALGQRAEADKPMHVIAYASRTMDPTKLHYTTIEKELLAIVFSLDKFCSYLLGSKIFMFSDHAALIFLLKKPNAKPRVNRWILHLQEFNIEIRDKKGADNLKADHLSQIKRENDLMPIRDEFLNEQLLHITMPTPWFTDIYNIVVACHVAPGGDHYGSTRMAMKGLTNLSPPTKNVKKLEWPLVEGMRSQQPILPFPVSNGYSYILLAIDYVSRWVEVIATKTNDVKVVVDFLKSNIFCRFGTPKALISDQGIHFCNRVMSSLLHKYRVVHRIATAYHPQTNNQAEVFNNEIKKTLQKMTNPSRKD
ncbi:Retrovirus-related Pol polyprotein from transposon 17.6, partial [Mucuna pruriens]